MNSDIEEIDDQSNAVRLADPARTRKVKAVFDGEKTHGRKAGERAYAREPTGELQPVSTAIQLLYVFAPTTYVSARLYFDKGRHADCETCLPKTKISLIAFGSLVTELSSSTARSQNWESERSGPQARSRFERCYDKQRLSLHVQQRRADIA